MIGQNIKLMREFKGWSQEQLARMMGYKSKSTINKIEKNINDVNQSTLDKFAKVFKCETTDLLSDDPIAMAFSRHDSVLADEYIQRQVKDSMNITDAEYGLIIAYRKADESIKVAVNLILNYQFKEKNDQAI